MFISNREIKSALALILNLIICGLIISCDDEVTPPNQIGRVDVGVAYDVFLEGETAYVTNNSGIVIIDIKNPGNPFRVGNIPNAAAVGFDIKNDTLVASGNQFSIYDVRISNNPIKICQFTGRSAIMDAVRTKGGLGVIMYSNGGIEIINVNDFNHPSSVGYLSTSWQGNDLEVLGDIAYVANSRAGLEIIDFSDPSHPRKIKTVSGTSGAWDINIKDDLLFLGCHMYGIKILDISEPSSPFVIGSYNAGGEVYGVYSWQNFLAVADLQKGVFLLNVNNPTNPVKISEDNSYHPHDIYYDGSYIYLADQDQGFVVLNLPR